MSEKVLKILEAAEVVVKKVDQHLDKAIKLSTNANMHLEFGTEGTKALYQVIVLMQKKGAKGDKVGDYKNSEIPKFLKEIDGIKARLTAAIKENNAACAQATQFLKLIGSLDSQIGALAKDKAIATNGEAIKLLMEARKKLMSVEGALDDVAKFGLISTNQPKFIDVTDKTKVDDLKNKLPMQFQAAIKDWEKAGGKIDDSKRKLRTADFNSAMKLASKLAV